MATALAVFLLFTLAAAQEHSRNRESAPVPSVTGKKAKRGPRAIAVVEFLPNGAMRLVPVALWIEGHYYDASLYGANPEPMAVEPQTVYEAQSFGEPTGTFTITMPRQVNGNWVADGTWQPELPMDAQLKAKAAKEAAQRSKDAPSKVVSTGDADEGRPVLKRAPGSAGDTTSSGQPAASTGTSTSTSSDSDRPVMKRPASESSSKPTMGPSDDSSGSRSTSTAKSQAQVDDHDPNRPVMKRPTATPASNSGSGDSGSTAVTQASATSNDNDPNRPVLSHTKATKPPVQSTADFPESKAGTTPALAGKGLRAYPAISDAGQYERRSLIYSMSSGERQGFEQQALKLAMDEIRAFAAKRNGQQSRKPRPSPTMTFARSTWTTAARRRLC